MINWLMTPAALAGHSPLTTYGVATALALSIMALGAGLVFMVVDRDEWGDLSDASHRRVITLFVVCAVLLVAGGATWLLVLGNATSDETLMNGSQMAYEWDVFYLIWKLVLVAVAAVLTVFAVKRTRVRRRFRGGSIVVSAAWWSPVYALALGSIVGALVIPV